jgi:hypothetical protein
MDWKRFYPTIIQNDLGKFTEDGFKNFMSDSITRKCVERTNQFIEKIIRYEKDILKDRFQLSGFRERLEFFDFPLAEYVYFDTIEKAFEMIKDLTTRTQYLLLRQKYHSLNSNFIKYDGGKEDSAPLFDEFKKFIPIDTYNKLLLATKINSFQSLIEEKITIFDWWVGDSRDLIYKMLIKESNKGLIESGFSSILEDLIKWEVVKLYDY